MLPGGGKGGRGCEYSMAILEGSSLQVMHSLGSSLRAIKAWMDGTFIHFPWELQNRPNCKIVLKVMVPLTGQTSLSPNLYGARACCKRILAFFFFLRTQGPISPSGMNSRGVSRHCGLVPHLQRDRYTLNQELEASLLISGLY